MMIKRWRFCWKSIRLHDHHWTLARTAPAKSPHTTTCHDVSLIFISVSLIFISAVLPLSGRPLITRNYSTRNRSTWYRVFCSLFHYLAGSIVYLYILFFETQIIKFALVFRQSTTHRQRLVSITHPPLIDRFTQDMDGSCSAYPGLRADRKTMIFRL